jgi:hypothetical protein
VCLERIRSTSSYSAGVDFELDYASESASATSIHDMEIKVMLDTIESKAFSESSLQSILILSNGEILCSNRSSLCTSLSFITFGSNSYLTRIESKAFYRSSLELILIPSNVEIRCSNRSSFCQSFSSITFESNSRFT